MSSSKDRQGAVVTGGSGGIGRGIVKRLTGDGYRVINLDLHPPASPLPGEQFVDCDLADYDALERVAERVAQDNGPLLLVNNAAWARPADFTGTSLSDFERTLAVNIIGMHLLCQALVPGMEQAGFGRIVNISSIAAAGKRDRTAYATSKAGIEGFTRTLALELGEHGITVNAIRPGPIDTAAFREANPAGSVARTRIEAHLPVGRMGSPADIANAVAFFLAEGSSFVTGQVLSVCGGRSVGGA